MTEQKQETLSKKEKPRYTVYNDSTGTRKKLQNKNRNSIYSDNWSLYTESAFVSALVDLKINDATRNGINFISSNSSELNSDFKKTTILDIIRKAIKQARVYGGSGVIIIDKNKAPSEPFDINEINQESDLIFHSFSSRHLLPAGNFEYDIYSKDFLNIEYYFLSMNNKTTPDNNIHHSRVIKFHGCELLTDDLMFGYNWNYREYSNQYYYGWGRSILPDKLFDQIEGLDDVYIKLPKIIKKGNTDIFNLKDLAASHSSNVNSFAEDLINELNETQSQQDAILLPGESSYQRIASTFSGYKELLESLVQYVTIKEKYPLTYFLGSPTPGSFLNGGSQDMQAYYATIADMQKNQIRPGLNLLLDIWQMNTYGKIYEDLDYDFNPLFEPNPNEKAEIESKTINNLNSLYDRDLLSGAKVLEALKNKTSIPIEDEDIRAAEELEKLNEPEDDQNTESKEEESK